MKIAILTPTFYHYSGIDRVVENQAELYAKKGSNVTVFALDSNMNGKKFNVEVLGMPKSLFLQRIYRLFFFLDLLKIRKYARKLRNYDMVISHFYPMNLIASLAKKKYDVKYVYHNHGVGYDRLFSNLAERVYMKIFGYLNKISLKNADEAVSVSKFLQSELLKETGIKSKVQYNKIDSRKFNRNVDRKIIRKKFRIKKNEKLLLFVGRISPHKNVHSLLKIFDIVSGKSANVKLLIVGKPTFPLYYNELKKAANKNVIFVEDVEDEELPFYYGACDLYVTASLWEGFNLPIVEAQACGRKVVAFDVCSHPEVVKNGILVEKGDVEGFAKAILKIILR